MHTFGGFPRQLRRDDGSRDVGGQQYACPFQLSLVFTKEMIFMVFMCLHAMKFRHPNSSSSDMVPDARRESAPQLFLVPRLNHTRYYSRFYKIIVFGSQVVETGVCLWDVLFSLLCRWTSMGDLWWKTSHRLPPSAKPRACAVVLL